MYRPSALSQRNGRRVAERQGGTVYYLHGDHLGSVSLTTTSSGAQQMTSRYTLFGSVRSSSGGVVSDYRFTGQRQESLGNNWLYDYNGRFYNALIGRFPSADSVVPGAGNPQALNRYSYALNDPLKYTDPSGHCAKADDECNELEKQTSEKYGITISGLSKAEISALQDLLGAMSENTRGQLLRYLRGVVGDEQSAFNLLRQSNRLSTVVVLNSRQGSVMATNGAGFAIQIGGELSGEDNWVSELLSGIAIAGDTTDALITGGFAVGGIFAPEAVPFYRAANAAGLVYVDIGSFVTTVGADLAAGRTWASYANGRAKVWVGLDSLANLNSMVWGGLISTDPWTASVIDGLKVTWDSLRISKTIPGASFFAEYIPMR